MYRPLTFKTPSILSDYATCEVPAYLKPYSEIFRQDPKTAAIEWFCDAKYGLFIHYGLCSLLGKNGWAMRNEKIPLLEHMNLMNRFTAENWS